MPATDRARRRTTKIALFSAFFAVALTMGSSKAQAFCRSTACDLETEDCEKDENGCPRTGPPLTWRTLPLTYRFHRGGSSKLDTFEARTAIRAAFKTWSNAKCNGKRTSLRFEEGDEIRKDKPLGESKKASEPFGIFFRDDEWPYNGADALALTNQTYGKINGWIDYADIEINTSTEMGFSTDKNESQGPDLQAVMTHEVGHFIGLAHSHVPGSIMKERYCEDSARCNGDLTAARALGDDDIDAVCAMYPPSGQAGVLYEPPASGCAVSPASGSPSSGDGRGTALGATLGALAVVVTRLRRRRSARPPV